MAAFKIRSSVGWVERSETHRYEDVMGFAALNPSYADSLVIAGLGQFPAGLHSLWFGPRRQIKLAIEAQMPATATNAAIETASSALNEAIISFSASRRQLGNKAFLFRVQFDRESVDFAIAVGC